MKTNTTKPYQEPELEIIPLISTALCNAVELDEEDDDYGYSIVKPDPSTGNGGG